MEFLLAARRDAAAAKRFLVKAIEASGNAMPRVMNVDKNPAYPSAVVLRQCKYLNNVIEQDHRSGIETVIRKGRLKWLAKQDSVGQALFIDALFGLAAA